MKHAKATLWVGVLLCLALVGAPASFGQAVTTGTLSGRAEDQSGGVLPGASVVALHEPTGTRYSETTNSDGEFAIQNVRVGGPYTVTLSLSGFKDEVQRQVFVSLGSERHLSFRLGVEALQETVEVSAEVGSIIDPSRSGTASNVASEALQNLPTVSRGLEDFARLSPHFNTAADNDGPARLSVAGRNNRYNNIQIDGAVNNDLFGLAASGAPGGQTEAQPVSLDAIQEIQLVVAPYDVRQGGFSGGGLNAITKSGSNTYSGTAYWFLRNQNFVGKGVDDRKVGTFDEDQFGASLGGPLVKNKAFFFVNADFGRKKVPSGFSVDGSSGQAFGRVAEVNRFLGILQRRYNYNPGGLEEFTRGVNSDKFFGRLDFNLNDSHRLTLRHNFIDADNDIGTQTNRLYRFADNFYEIRDKTNSTVAQLNSRLNDSMYNELRVTYQTIRDQRDGPTNFPFVEVTLSDGSRLDIGRERFSTANQLDQDVIEVTNDLTWTRGRHVFVLGTHNEFFKFDNLFIRDNFGAYEFASLDLLEQGQAQSFDYSFSSTANPRQSAKFKVNQWGFYAGDTWRATSELSLTLGARLDLPSFPEAPTRNPASEAAFGYRTDVVPSPALFSPRLGFNWSPRGTGRQQVRGGVGLFAGRTPYVWLSNQYGNTGIEFTRLRRTFSGSNRIPFVPDPNAQPRVLTGGTFATNEIDLVDPDYSFPKVLRGNLAYDRELGFWGLFGTAEFLFASTVKDIAYSNINLVPGTRLPDGRPVFRRQVASLSDVILLSNTDKGSQWSASLKLERPFKNGLFLSGSYLYGRAKSVNDGTSSQAASNWRFVQNPGNPNDPPLAFSNFDVRHRINLAASYDFKLGGNVRTVLSLFYNGQSGRPYSTIFLRDANGDGSANDIIFVPAGASDVIVTGGTWEQLNAYIEADEGLRNARGTIPGRNTSRSPWTDSLDFRAAFNLPWGPRRFEVTLDVLNVLNLIDKSKGLVEYASFNDVQPIDLAGVDGVTGKMIYNISTLTSASFRKFDRDDLRSRWQAQLGLRFRF